MIFRSMLPFLCCAALIVIAPARAAETATTSRAASVPTTRSAPISRTANRIVLIQPSNFNFSPDDFYIAAKERARAKIASKSGGDDAATDDRLGNWLFVNHNGNEVEMIVRLPQAAPPIAAEVADDLIDFMRSFVVNENDRMRKESLERAEHDFATGDTMARDANKLLQQIRDQLRDLSGRSDVSPKTLTSALSNMDDELQHLKIERLSKDARRAALEEQIAQLTERVQKKIDSDPIAAELQKVVDAREENAKATKQMYEQGSVSRADLSQAVAQAAEAKAKLLQQQRDASAAAGGTSLEAFNRELMTLAIDAKELDTKAKYLEDRLPRLRQAVELLDDYGRIERRANEANGSLEVVTRNVQDARAAHAQNDPPRILVKESKNEREE